MPTPSKPEVLTRERCFIEEYLNDPTVPEVSVAKCRVEPGVTTELHSLDVLEWYCIQSGTGLMRVGDKPPFYVAIGDAIRIPVDCEQQITNVGDTDLLFLCICIPRFTPPSYRAQE